MKKTLIIATLIALITGIQTAAPALQSTNRQMNAGIAKQINENKTQPDALEYVNKIFKLFDRYSKNMRECVPFHLNQDVDLFGLKFSYSININGWQNNKCVYSAKANVGSLGKDIREVFDLKVSDKQISEITPEIQCEFTKEQLNILVDGFVASQQRKMAEVNKNLLSNEVTVSNKKRTLSPEEEKMIEMLVSQNTCTVLNKDKLLEQFTQLSQPQL